jgi:hypothetical protein
MTKLTKATNRGFSANMLIKAIQVPGFTAGEDLTKLDAVRLDPTDGKIYRATSGSRMLMTTGSAINPSYRTDYLGFVPYGFKSGEEGVTVVRGVAGDYGTSMTPGSPIFISETAGSLCSGSSVNSGDPAIGIVLTSTKILIF